MLFIRNHYNGNISITALHTAPLQVITINNNYVYFVSMRHKKRALLPLCSTQTADSLCWRVSSSRTGLALILQKEMDFCPLNPPEGG